MVEWLPAALGQSSLEIILVVQPRKVLLKFCLCPQTFTSDGTGKFGSILELSSACIAEFMERSGSAFLQSALFSRSFSQHMAFHQVPQRSVVWSWFCSGFVFFFFPRVSSEDGKYQSSVLFQQTTAFCASLSSRPGTDNEQWLLFAIFLTGDLVQLGSLLNCLFFQKKCSLSHDSASVTILFAGKHPPGFIFAVC